MQSLDDVVETLDLHRVGLATRNCAAARHEQMRVLGNDDVLIVEVERLVETFAQFGKILQRTAQECDVPADRPAAREAADGLRDDRLENGSRDVFLARTLVEQGLHVGLGKHAATARNRIDGRVAFGQLVQTARIGVEQRCHLVDERAGTTSARAVHALFDRLAEVDDLRILAAKLDCDIGLGNERLDSGLAGNDLLHEFHIEPLCQKQAARTSDGERSALVAVLDSGSFEHLCDGRTHVGVMAFVNRPDDLVFCIENRKLDRSRANVDTDAQRIPHRREGHRRRDLDVFLAFVFHEHPPSCSGVFSL